MSFIPVSIDPTNPSILLTYRSYYPADPTNLTDPTNPIDHTSPTDPTVFLYLLSVHCLFIELFFAITKCY